RRWALRPQRGGCWRYRQLRRPVARTYFAARRIRRLSAPTASSEGPAATESAPPTKGRSTTATAEIPESRRADVTTVSRARTDDRFIPLQTISSSFLSRRQIMFERASQLAEHAANNVSRRQFLGRFGSAALGAAAAAGGLLALPTVARAGRRHDKPCGPNQHRSTCPSGLVVCCDRGKQCQNTPNGQFCI